MDEIKKEHLLAAIKEIETNPLLRKGRASSTYDLIFEGKDYPPKLVISIANRYATGDELDPNTFSGGLGTPAFLLLEKEGFEIKKKSESMNRYQLKETFLNEWPLSRIEEMTLEEYTNLDKTSFCYWLEAKTENLGSIWGGSAYKFGIYKRKDTNTKITVDNRVTDGEYAWFQKYGATKETAFQTVKNILLNIIENTEKGTLENIDSIDLGDAYKWKIAFLYGDYNVVNIYKHESLLEAAQSLGFKDSNKNYSVLNQFILSQKKTQEDYFEFTDALWSKTSLANKTKYWLYAPGENSNKWEEFYSEGIMGLGWDDIGDLKKYNSRDEIKEALVKAYGGEGSKKNDVSANDDFLNKVNIGDIVIAKKGRGELLGYGIVISEYYFDENKIDYKSCRKIEWKLKGNWKVDFNLVLKTLTDITKYETEDPIYYKYHERLMGIMLNNNKLNYKEAYIKWLDIKSPNESGKKSSYIRAIEILSETIGYYIFEEDNVEKMDLLYEDLIVEQRIKGGKYWNKNKPSYGGNGFYSAAIKTYSDFLKDYLSKNNHMKTFHFNAPLNQILYGPPGTGKTYNTVLEAAKIITGNETIIYEEALKIFNDNLGTQIEFITFHQNYSYEDFIQGLRPDTANGSALTFEKKDGVFKRIADKANENLKLADKAPEELSKEVQFDQALEIFKDSILDTQDKYNINDAVYIFEIDEEAFRYTGTNWEKHANGIRMKFTDLKEFYRNNVKTRKDIKALTTISGLANQHATYYLLVYEAILKFLPNKVEQQVKVDRKNYVIIIDEINRANISRVFGELITLIEEDKRSHGKIPMKATLPSGDSFIVPSNLYIIGTMNTADKSIALLDIALRRRFEFIAMYPNETIVNAEFRAVFAAINKAILDRKNHDFTIGHAYFMGDDCKLEKIINNKVIPLLMEYFMNDEKEVTAILQAAKLSIGGWPLKMIV
jgi:5-methylcytosine-specific restriction endonuclease McrBC GTP-binding regulatory subunit McrB